MSVYCSGDTHGKTDMDKLSSKRWPIGKTLTKEDYLIIAGDFGVIWNNIPDGEEKYLLNWLREKPWTTLVVDGNHENFCRLEKMEQISKFGGIVGFINDSVFHLKRGEIYTINGKKFFTFGGAVSIDKKYRKPYLSWWPQEVPSNSEMNYGIDNLLKNDNKVDYIISHTAPKTIKKMFLYDTGQELLPFENDPTEDYLDHIISEVTFEKLYCGHFHEEYSFGKFEILYQRIIQII